MQSGTGVLEEVGGQQRQQNGQIRQESIGQEYLTKPAAFGGEGEGFAEIGAGGGKGDGGNLAARQLDERATEEVADAHAEGGHGKAGHVLVGPEGHSQQAVQQTHQQRAQQGAQHRDSNGQKAVHRGRRGGLLVEERTDDAADAAHIHDAGDT